MAWALAEHRELDEEIRTLNTFLTFCPTAPNSVPEGRSGKLWSRDLAAIMMRLADRLGEHFKYEETSGFFQKLVRDFPEYTHRINELLQDHQIILGKLEHIRQDALSNSTIEGATGLRKRAEEVVARLKTHEHSENELLQRAYSDDRGPGD